MRTIVRSGEEVPNRKRTCNVTCSLCRRKQAFLRIFVIAIHLMPLVHTLLPHLFGNSEALLYAFSRDRSSERVEQAIARTARFEIVVIIVVAFGSAAVNLRNYDEE